MWKLLSSFIEITRSRTPLSGNTRQTIRVEQGIVQDPKEASCQATQFPLWERPTCLCPRSHRNDPWIVETTETAFTPDSKASQDPDILFRSVSHDTEVDFGANYWSLSLLTLEKNVKWDIGHPLNCVKRRFDGWAVRYSILFNNDEVLVIRSCKTC